MSVYFKSSAVINTSKSFHYSAPDYRYSLHNDGPHGTRANLQVKKEIMDLFIERVGAINTVGLPHLMVCQSGGGWYLITTLTDYHAHMVTKFLARFNKWMTKRNEDKQPKTLQVLANNSLHTRYAVEAPAFNHPTSRPLASRTAPTLGALSLLAHKFSKRTGDRHA